MKIQPLFAPLNPYSALNTDLYELITGVGFKLMKLLWDNSDIMRSRLVHDAYFRKFPASDEKKGDMYGYMIQSGVGPLVDFLLNARFSEDDISYLKSLPAFRNGHGVKKGEILNRLLGWRFTGDLEAIPEGMPITPFIPLVRISGNPFDTHIAETMTLMCLNTGTALSTKARRITYHARGLPVIDMSFRRMIAGVGGTAEIVRALALGGFSGTSHVQAAKVLGLRPVGTHPHSWVMFLGTDRNAFEIYGLLYPENYCALLDTFDTLKKGVLADIEVTKRLVLRKLRVAEDEHEEETICAEWSPDQWRELLKANKSELGCVVYFARNDSGDQEYFTREIWKAYEEAGLSQVKQIIITNDLDEYLLDQILEGESVVHMVGVGTKAVSELLSTGVVYKLAAIIEPDGKIRSVVKSGNPAKSTVQYPNVPLVLFGSTPTGNTIQGYVVCLPEEVDNLRNGGTVEVIHPYSPQERVKIQFDSAQNLLVKGLSEGKLVVSPAVFTDTQSVVIKAARCFNMLPKPHKRLWYPQRMKYGLSPGLFEARRKLMENAGK